MVWGGKYFCLFSAINKLNRSISSSAPPNYPSLRGYRTGLPDLPGVSFPTTHHHNARENAKSLICNGTGVRLIPIMLNWLFFDQWKSAARARPPHPFLKKKEGN